MAPRTKYLTVPENGATSGIGVLASYGYSAAHRQRPHRPTTLDYDLFRRESVASKAFNERMLRPG